MTSLDIFIAYHYKKEQALHQITPVSKTDVEVLFFTSGSRDITMPTSRMRMSFVQFRNWFNMNLHFLEVDSEPVESIELIFPLLPSALIKHYDLPRMRGDIMMALKFTEDQWATQTPVVITSEWKGGPEEEDDTDTIPLSPTDSG